MERYNNPLSLALTGICLIIVGMLVVAFLPIIANVGAFVVKVGYAFIVIAVVLFIIKLIKGESP